MWISVINILSCSRHLKGDLIDWESASWQKTNAVVRDLKWDDVCNIQDERINVAFSYPRTMPRLRLICSALNATVSTVDKDTSYEDLFGLFNPNWTSLRGPSRWDHVWVGWSDAHNEGNFTHVSTREPMETDETNVRWRAGEPNGGREENCVALNDEELVDVPCFWVLSGFCHMHPRPRMKLRGENWIRAISKV